MYMYMPIISVPGRLEEGVFHDDSGGRLARNVYMRRYAYMLYACIDIDV